MKGPEYPVQLQLGEERENTSNLHEVADQAHSHIILYLNEGKGMKQCASSLREILEGKGKKVRLIHYHQLLFDNWEEWLKYWPFAFDGYSSSPLVLRPEEQCVTIVESFHSFDGKRMTETMAKLNQTKDLVTWIFLVPYWRQIKQSQVLLAWARERKAKIIHFNPDKEED